MKWIKKILLIIILLVVPTMVYATDKEEVNVYIFRGEGCPRCEEALTYFASLENKHGEKFELKEYEVWYNKSNSNLMNKVANVLKENPDGVPYIVIGNTTFEGYSNSLDDEIVKAILDEYDSNDRYDVMVELESLDINIMSNPIVMVVFVCMIGFFITLMVVVKKG